MAFPIESKIVEWAEQRGIFEKATPLTQFEKTQEEVEELEEALATDDYMGTLDAIGDITVTLVILAEMCNTSLESCIDLAYREIENRKGKMINGIFVKESDLPK